MKIPAALESQAVLIGLGVFAVLIFAANSRSITAGAVTGAAEAVAGVGQGIADAINTGINAVTPKTAEGRSRTFGEWVWDITHPREADALEYGEDLQGNIFYPSGTRPY